MNARSLVVFSLIALALGARLPAGAQDEPDAGEPAAGSQPLVQGPAVVGNGVTNGIGTALGRLFLVVRGLEGDGSDDPGVPVEIPLTSSTLRVEPTTCAASSQSECAAPGTGVAAVNGFPTTFATNFMNVRMAGAMYLPFHLAPPMGGSSFEIAIEGTINVGTRAPEGATCTALLHESDPDLLRAWAGESTPDRPFQEGTGTGVLLSDTLVYGFPGRLTGVVLKNDGKAVLVGLRTAEFRAGITVPGRELTLEPDFEAAAAAGLPEDTFFVLEMNYTGLPSPSGVYPGAATNDVEILLTTRPLPRDFARGDCNGDGDAIHGLVDAIFLLQFNFLGGPEPPCLIACDVDGDGFILGRVTDALYLLTFAFVEGPPPPPPFPDCGESPTGDPTALGCETPVCGSS